MLYSRRLYKESVPMKLITIVSMASLLAILPAGIGCDDTSTTSSNKTLSELEITTGIDTMTKGDSMQFTAMARYADGTSEDVSKSSGITWNTSEPENATVDENGMVTAVDEGPV